MGLSTQQDLILVVIGVVILLIIVVALKVMLPSLIRQRRSHDMDGTTWAEDRSWNQIQAGLAMADFVEREGLAAAPARVKLEQAQMKYDLKRYPEASRLAKEATDLLSEVRRKGKVSGTPVPPGSGRSSSEPSPPEEASPGSAREAPTHRDLAKRVGDRESDEDAPLAAGSVQGTRSSASRGAGTSLTAAGAGALGGSEEREEGAPPTTEEEDSSLATAARKMPKNYMEARFMLNALQNDLGSLTPERRTSPEGKEAQEWARQSQAAFDRKDYDASLRLALRGRRRIGGGGLSTIALSPGTVVEPPPEEPVPAAQRSSAPQTAAPASSEEGPKPCARCGRTNTPTDRFCRGCGAPLTQPKCPRCQRPVETDDRFCHGCGSPLGTPA